MAANATVPNTFTNATTADATQVNANFSAVLSWLNTNVVHLDASKAFTAVPSGPATDPTSANQLTRKAYVDAYFPVVNANLGDLSVSAGKIQDNAVIGRTINANAVDRSKLATNLLPVITVANKTARDALTSVVAGQMVFQSDISALLVHNGTNWSVVQAGAVGGSGNDFNINSGVVVGTGGVKNLGWTYVGGPSRGLLTVNVEIQLGTSGFSVASQPVIDFPALSGFTFTAADVFDNSIELGMARLVDAAPAGTVRGWAKRASSGTFTITTDLGTSTMSSTSPHTWAANDKMVTHFTVRGLMSGS